MMSAVTITWCLAVGALFDVYTVPGPPDATAFFAQSNAASDFCVLDGRTLTVYRHGEEDKPASVEFEDGVSVFDVADLDGDGQNEVVAICGTRVLRYPLPGEGAASGPQTLFEATTVFGDDTAGPAFRVLVVPFEGRTVLALPCPDAFELRAIDGSVAARFPYKKELPRVPGPERAYAWSSGNPPQVGPVNSLELSVWETRRLDPDLPGGLPRLDDTHVRYNRVWTQKGGKEAVWDSFPLRKDGNEKRRIYCNIRLQGGTRLALADLGEESREVRDEELGPKRRYPGLMVLARGDDPEDLPDFNADGYVDILLGRMPEFQISVDAVTRMAAAQTWPVRLTVHLFSPEKDRHDPKPAALLEFRAPVMAFLSFNPVDNIVMRDFDGDGRTDVGCSTDERTYSVWLYHVRPEVGDVRPEVGDVRPEVGDDGFSKEPEFSYSSPEPIQYVYARTKTDDSPSKSLVLRGEKAFHVLRANADGS